MRRIFTTACIIILLSATYSYAQTTYYSRNAGTPPLDWNDSDSWTLNSDGSGSAAGPPTRSDHVVILSGHTIVIDAVNDNGSSGVSPDGLNRSNVGSYPESNLTTFYQTGNITINSGGSLDVQGVRIMLEGKTLVDGSVTTTDDVINLGQMNISSGATFDCGDDLILTGTSRTVIDNTSTMGDDIYIDHTEATLCGDGIGNVGNSSPNTAIIYYVNGGSSSQICTDFNMTCTANCGGGFPTTGSGGFSLDLTTFNYVKTITIDATKVAGDLTDFPVLISITGDATLETFTNGGGVQNTNGYDIVFATAGDCGVLNQLDHQLESYDGSEGSQSLVAWVKIPELSSSVDTEIYMYYGNSSITQDLSVTSTFDYDHAGVWHLHDDFLDASGNANDGTNGATNDITGIIADGQNFNSSTDYIQIGTNSWSAASGTIELWARTNGAAFPDHDYIFGHTTQPSFNNRIQLYLDDQNNWLTLGMGDNHYTHINIWQFNTGQWYHVILTWDGTNYEVFVDGTSRASGTYTGLGTIYTLADLGNSGDPTNRNEGWNGIIDEVRVSKVVRSDAWIQTEYNNQSDPSTFFTVSSGALGISQCGPLSNGFSLKGPGGVGNTDGNSNLSLWLDAGTIAGVADGGSVTSWEDLSGNGYDAFVPASPDLNAPSYSATGGGNGQPAVTFAQASKQGMTAPGNSETMPTEELTAFVAGTMNGAGNYDIFLSSSADDDDTDGYGIFQDNSADRMGLWTDSWAERVSINGLGTEEAWCLIFNTTDNFNYGYKSESTPGTNAFNGPISYKGIGPNYDVQIGTAVNNSTFAYFLEGHIEEIILFDLAVNDAQRIIMANYLAAKYNISLANNDVYNEDDNGDYDFDVAGIGQAADGSKHIDAQGTGIIRILNARGLGNDEFLMWGHDNGVEFATETSDVPAGGDPVDARFNRVWRVSEANSSGTGVDVGDIDIRWDLTGKGSAVTASDLRLLIDTDNDGTFADEIPISGATLVSGNVYEFSAVSSIANNLRFTLATVNASQTPLVIAPGGVGANLALWLKANEGTSTTTDGNALFSWTDQGGARNSVAQATSSNQPFFRNNATNNINYNPVVDFDGTNDFLLDASGILGSATYTDLNVYSVVITDVVQNSNVFSEECSPLRFKVHAPHGDGTYYFDAGGNSGDYRLSTAWGGTTGESYLWSNLYSTTSGQTISGLRQVIERNGLVIASDNTASSTTGTSSQFNLGSNTIQTIYHNGKIAEIMVYTGAIDATQHKKIENYFGIKYGITLDNSGGGTDGDYVASDGTTIWDADVNAAYHNKIIAIGRDDVSGLYQKQSQSEDDSLTIYIDNLAADNTSNAGTITNDVSFIVIGHNGGRLMAYSPNEVPAGIFSRFDREWKITNTNFDDTYSLEFEWEEVGGFDISHIRLLVDDDGDFSNATILDTSDGLTFSVGSIIIGGIGTSHIPSGSTKYITIGSAAPATPLPIELINFNANPTDNFTVKLDWQTASENNNDFFTIERSKDAEEWMEVIIVDGAGNSSQKITYTATDKNPYSGISYYRLKQTDFDGQFTYSEIRVVNLNNLGSKELKIYPNPGNGLITIEGDLTELTTFKLYTVFGQEVSNMVRISSQNNVGMIIDISSLSDGVYTMKTKNYISKIIKQ